MSDFNKPLFTFRSRFHMMPFLWNNPIRILVCVLILSIMLPELERLCAFLFGFSGVGNTLFVFIGVFLCCVGMPLIITLLEYRLFPYQVYADNIQFTHNIFVREKITIPFKAIATTTKTANPWQKKYNLGNVRLSVKAGPLQKHEDGYVLPDIFNADLMHKQLNHVIETYHSKN